jgi:hypothetical protein
MASVSAIRDGIKTRLATIAGLHAYDTVEGQTESPAAVIYLDSISFDSTMARGSDDMVFVISLAVGGVDRVAQDTLDGYLDGSGATSIKAVMDADTRLGNIVSFARVAGVRNYGSTKVNGVTMWGADVIVEVLT